MFRHHDLPPLSVLPVQDAQDLLHRRVRIASHAAVIDDDKEPAITLHAAQLLGYVYEMPFAAIVSAHDVQFAIMPLISGVRVHFQIHVSIFREMKFLNVSVPVPDSDEEVFDVIVRRINAEIAVVDVELQYSVMHERSDLRSYVDPMVAGSIFRCYQLTALCCGRAREKKRQREHTHHTYDELFHIGPLRLVDEAPS